MPSLSDTATNDPATVSGVLDLWPSSSALAQDLGLKNSSHARVFRRRNRIPGWHWDALMAGAKRRGIALTRAALIASHEGQKLIGAPAWAVQPDC